MAGAVPEVSGGMRLAWDGGTDIANGAKETKYIIRCKNRKENMIFREWKRRERNVKRYTKDFVSRIIEGVM